MDNDWTRVDPECEMAIHKENMTTGHETMQGRIIRIQADQDDLMRYHNIDIAQPQRIHEYYVSELKDLRKAPFDDYNQEDKVDYLLLQNYLEGTIRRLDLESARIKKMEPLLTFAPPIIKLLEARQGVNIEQLEPQSIAQTIHEAAEAVKRTAKQISKNEVKVDKTTAFRTARSIASLRNHLAEFVSFFRGYQPLFDWWVSTPYADLDSSLKALIPIIQTQLAGMNPDSQPDEIVGEPIGRDGLLVELETEMIPYTPEELISAANEKYKWCISEMKKAASELGFNTDWKAALEHVKGLFVPPGEQIGLVKSLVDEGAEYVKEHNLVTVPALAENSWRMFMMPPAAQKVNPFFLGGPSIIVSYPTAAMTHADKLMGMRGNNRHFAKATAFHEMIPGHHLQMFVATRSRSYRKMFTTPFYIEGWAMYWELVFWDRGDFFDGPEDRIGTLFWRVHRCARILFSLKFHLGSLSPQECVDLLVDMVGHERATAEGEVRRSLNGDYSPLYQAGYMLGALQLHSLRKEVLDANVFGEKEFHDRVLRANEMPIEALRALLVDKELTRDYKSQWKFLG